VLPFLTTNLPGINSPLSERDGSQKHTAAAAAGGGYPYRRLRSSPNTPRATVFIIERPSRDLR
jgi:hypothetical protein